MAEYYDYIRISGLIASDDEVFQGVGVRASAVDDDDDGGVITPPDISQIARVSDWRTRLS